MTTPARSACHDRLILPRRADINIALGQLAVMAFVVADTTLLLIAGEDGVYAAVPRVILGYLVAISVAWILLVEFHR